jgi:hypothetical protein
LNHYIAKTASAQPESTPNSKTRDTANCQCPVAPENARETHAPSA